MGALVASGDRSAPTEAAAETPRKRFPEGESWGLGAVISWFTKSHRAPRSKAGESSARASYVRGWGPPGRPLPWSGRAAQPRIPAPLGLPRRPGPAALPRTPRMKKVTPHAKASGTLRYAPVRMGGWGRVGWRGEFALAPQGWGRGRCFAEAPLAAAPRVRSFGTNGPGPGLTGGAENQPQYKKHRM